MVVLLLFYIFISVKRDEMIMCNNCCCKQLDCLDINFYMKCVDRLSAVVYGIFTYMWK